MHINEQAIQQLPARLIAKEVNEQLRTNNRLVVTAPPGAGKSTLLPLTLLEGLMKEKETGKADGLISQNGKTGKADGQEGKILMLEPRRLAARQIAVRMASLLGERVGQTVGYRVRFDNCVSKETRLEVLTEGILTRMLTSDPALEGVSTIIFDEFHERSMASDLALALARESQEVLRPDLRLVLMSATIDTTALCTALDAPLVESEGRMFPVEVRYEPREQEGTTVDSIARDVARTLIAIHQQEEGDILAFLPGQAEIQRCQELLNGSFGEREDTVGDASGHNVTTRVLPLYGQLPFEQQQAAILPSPKGQRKIVLATNIAETSLTIEGVRIVVDSGLQRRMVYDQRTELSHLETLPISMDMARQRSGRAGRLAEGICIRLWNKAAENRMQENRQPELLEADLAPLVLDVAAWGEPHPERLPWLTLPPAARLTQASHLLYLLGATDEQGLITTLGKRMATMPCHPRIARMLLTAENAAQTAHQPQDAPSPLTSLACDIAALLEERDPMPDEPSTDINRRLLLMRQARRNKREGRLSHLLQIAEEYRKRPNNNRPPTPLKGETTTQKETGELDKLERLDRLDKLGKLEKLDKLEKLERLATLDELAVDEEQTGVLLATAYPERIAQAQDGLGHFRTAGGQDVVLDRSDELSARRWIAIAQLNAANGRVFLASPIDEAQLDRFAQQRERLSWDNKRGQLLCQSEQRIGVLLLDSRPLQATREQQVEALCEAAQHYGESMLDFSDTVHQLQRRVEHVAQWHPELALPDLSTSAVLQRAHDWLPFYLDNNGRLRTSVADLKRIDLAAALTSLLTYEQQQALDRLAPTHIVVPTGSHIRLDYRQGAEAPVLSVRLQECFGLTDTPCINDGRQPVLMELLSPGFKPVQLTQDLRNFWADTYFEVRKELRRRYPKHSWPDNPLEAEATRGVRRK